jgi:hypothetical protein
MSEVDHAVTHPQLDGLHDVEGRRFPPHWLLIDALNARGFVLPAEVVRASVIAQMHVGWTATADLCAPFDGDESGPEYDSAVS